MITELLASQLNKESKTDLVYKKRLKEVALTFLKSGDVTLDDVRVLSKTARVPTNSTGLFRTNNNLRVPQIKKDLLLTKTAGFNNSDDFV